MRGRIARVVVAVDEPARATLDGWLRSPQTPVGRATRARAILVLAAGDRDAPVAERVGLAARPVRTWALRFQDQGVVGLHDKPRPGRTPVLSP